MCDELAFAALLDDPGCHRYDGRVKELLGVHRFLILVALSLVSGCFQVQNSFENDEINHAYRKPLDPGDPEDAALIKVRKVFVENNCVSCHATEGGVRFQGFLSYSNEDWETRSCGGGSDTPCITRGSKNQSYLFKRLRTSECYPDYKECDMPKDADLSDADVQIIVDWIEGS
ncbi:MAG TPA: hypothetical protein VM901_05880 [Bdellovibrionota bacterium]|jgi:hypothetical protein|nr:hypothetical protein [Bdellovibrionota bacterium]